MAPRKDNIGEHTIALELENIGWLKMQKQYWNKKITESKEKETREEFQQLLQLRPQNLKSCFIIAVLTPIPWSDPLAAKPGKYLILKHLRTLSCDRTSFMEF